ncbi:hypothetical protein [Parasphingorhabdus sp.]|uniref:hypothetical protein n=1 Tax=Parasphingorhabdus sp. TaxID=2709688 RepID=UPI003A920CC9
MKSYILAAAAIVSAVSLSTPARADEHPGLGEPLSAFHDLLKIDWHREAGPSRNRAACANIGQYILLSQDIVAEAAPHIVAEADWKPASRALLDASVALGAYCSSAMDENVVAGLSTIHSRFHDLMALAETN